MNFEQAEARWLHFQEAIARAFEGLHATQKCTCPGCADSETFDAAKDERDFDAFFLKQMGIS